MKKRNFKSNEKKAHVNPVNFYNNFVETDKFVNDITEFEQLNDKKGTIKDTNGCTYTPDPDREGHYIVDGQPKCDDLADGMSYSKFELLQVYRFKGVFRHACSYVQYHHLEPDKPQKWPYIFVKKDFYKIVYRKNKWNVPIRQLNAINEKTLIHLEGRQGLERTIANMYFDDFVIHPDNTSYHHFMNGMYNLYHPFPHVPDSGKVTADDISYTLNFMKHVFGNQLELGLQYMKILYEEPTQKLPIVVLVSKERHTGKTSFLNYVSMIFGGNYVQISPDDLVSQFNASYSTKNIIGVDETVIDRTSAIERIKSLVTADTLMVNQKNISHYDVDFYGKLIMTSNKEVDFMRVDDGEIRFWVRKLQPFGKMDVKFYEILHKEIPKFLNYLSKLERIESKTRMVFTADQLKNDELERVMIESRSGLHKELETLICEFFESNNITFFEATLSDIKNRWFERDSRISQSYIKKVLEGEMGYKRQDMKRYSPMNDGPGLGTKPGTPYMFKRHDFTDTHYDVSDGYSIVNGAEEDKF